jgi:hypothetical protein
MAERKHGTKAKYVVDRCRCTPCKAGNRAYENRRKRLIAYGQWEPYIDAAPVRAHVEQLRAAGLGWKRIASLAGLGSSTVWKLIYGDSRRGQAPVKRMRRETAEKLLAVHADLDLIGGAAKVDATGTRRRVQALVAIGWSQSKLADQIGMTPSNFGQMLQRDKVMAHTARSVIDLYERLWNTAPPESDWRDKIAASRARHYAAERGWVPPLGWDEADLDDPAAGPAEAAEAVGVDEIAVELALSGNRVSLSRIEAAEVVRIGTERGMSARRLAELTGRTTRSIHRRRSA